MLRCMILSHAWCSATWSFCHTSCYAAWSCLMPDAPLLDLSVTLCVLSQKKKTICSQSQKTWKHNFGSAYRHHWFLLGYVEKKHTYPVDHLSSEARRVEWLDLEICQDLAAALGNSTCWICLLFWKKQASTCPRCESNCLRLLKLGFRREKARYAANCQVRNLIEIQYYQWFWQNALGGRLQTIQKHAQNAGKHRSVIIDETPKNVISHVQLSTRRVVCPTLYDEDDGDDALYFFYLWQWVWPGFAFASTLEFGRCAAVASRCLSTLRVSDWKCGAWSTKQCMQCHVITVH